MTGPYFRTEDLTVGYGSVPVLRDAVLAAEPGEIVSLIGPNGAGKTTLLKTAARQLAPLRGTVWLDGRDLASLSLDAAAREISVLLTERIRPELMTCREVAAAGRYPYTGRFGRLGEADRAVLERTMERVRVDDLADRYFSRCSDGQKQRVLLARALCQEPRLLVLDEPTAYLDLRYQLQLLSLLQTLAREEGLTVLMSLHEVDLAARVSHRVACIRDGRVERFGPPEAVLTPGYIRDLYGIDRGSYDDRSGTLELAPPEGPPRVFVLCGAGTGTASFRRLQRDGIPFAAGVLWENDLDWPAARALAAETVSLPAFAPMTEEILARAGSVMDGCERVIPALEEESMNGAAAPLRGLLARARAAGKTEARHGV